MRTYLFAIVGAAFFALPTSAFSQDIEFGRGGVRIYPHHHRHYGYGADCRELREACLRKEELGEEGRAIAADIAQFAEGTKLGKDPSGNPATAGFLV